MKRLQSLHIWVTENLEKTHRRQTSYYNLRRCDRIFGVGELVLRRQHVLSSATQNVAAKLTSKFCGPFKIKRILFPVVYELVGLDGVALGKVHVQDLKSYSLSERCLIQELSFPSRLLLLAAIRVGCLLLSPPPSL